MTERERQKRTKRQKINLDRKEQKIEQKKNKKQIQIDNRMSTGYSTIDWSQDILDSGHYT